EGEDQLGGNRPDGRGDARPHWPHRTRPLRWTVIRRRGQDSMGANLGSYDRLTALDASFLHLERLEYPMHVGAVSVFEGEPFFDENGRFRINDARDLVLSRLPLLPRFRKKLMTVPYDQGRPIWVDDQRFDISYHVRHTALPKPGSWEQLMTLT